MGRLGLTSLLLSAFWPVWVWYVQRYFDRSDEPLGAFALITFLILIFLRREKANTSIPATFELITGIISLVCYSATFCIAPKAVQGVFALTALGIFLPRILSKHRLHICDWILLYMTLPVVSTLNFYLGYPARFLIAHLASWVLWLCHYPVSVAGVSIFANGQYLEVDPPCGGIKILWFMIFLASALAGLFKFDWKNTLRIITISITLAIIGNPLRIALLYILQVNGILQGEMEHWIHIGTGLSVYSIVMLLLILIAISMSSNKPSTVEKPIFSNPFSPQYKVAFMLLCFGAMLMPLIPLPVKSQELTVAFPGWPQAFEGAQLSKLPDSEIISQYERDFPGKIAVFSKGNDIVCLRWIAHETRQVHPSADCFHSLGYSIDWKPTVQTTDGHFWNCLSCTRATKKLEIRESISDSTGKSWSDVSAWYWDAFLKRTSPPWWSATVISKL
jgi:exosortase/archaeosortase family protein